YTFDENGKVASLQNIAPEVRFKLAWLGTLSSVLMFVGNFFPPAAIAGAATKFAYDAANNQVSFQNALTVAAQVAGAYTTGGQGPQWLAPALTATSAALSDNWDQFAVNLILTAAGVQAAQQGVGQTVNLAKIANGVEAAIVVYDGIESGSVFEIAEGVFLLGASFADNGDVKFLLGGADLARVGQAVEDGDLSTILTATAGFLIRQGIFTQGEQRIDGTPQNTPEPINYVVGGLTLAGAVVKLVDNADDGLVTDEILSFISSLNSGVTNLTGQDQLELLGGRLTALFGGDRPIRGLIPDMNGLTERGYDREVRILYDAEGEPVAFLGLDGTEIGSIEKAVDGSHNFYLFDANGDEFFVFNHNRQTDEISEYRVLTAKDHANGVEVAGPIDWFKGLFGGGNEKTPQSFNGLQTVDSIDGLEQHPFERSLFYLPEKSTEPTALQLDGGSYALAGVTDPGGFERQFYTFPSFKEFDSVDWHAQEGDIVEEGQLLYTLQSTEVDNELREAQDSLEAAEDRLAPVLNEGRRQALSEKGDILKDLGEIDTSIRNIAIEIRRLDTDIRSADGSLDTFQGRIDAKNAQIAAAAASVARNQASIDQIDGTDVEEQGGVSNVHLVELRDQLGTAKEVLAEFQGDLAEIMGERDRVSIARNGLVSNRDLLVEQKDTLYEPQIEVLNQRLEQISVLENLTPEEALRRVQEDDTNSLTPAVADAANAVLAAKGTLSGAQQKKDDLEIRSPIDGKFSQVLPDGLRFNLLDGTVKLVNDTSTGLGQVPSDPERNRPTQGADGTTPSVTPLESAPAVISLYGLAEAQADKYTPGEKVTFQTEDGRLGTVEVVEVTRQSTNGYRVVLENPMFLDGTGLTMAESAPIRVFDSDASRLHRSTHLINPIDNVAFAPPSALIVNPQELPQVEQDFFIKVPVLGVDDRGEEVVIAHVEVTGRTQTDGRVVRLMNGTTAKMTRADSDVSVPVEVNISDLTLTATGSSTAESPREKSGVEFQVSVPFIDNNGTVSRGRSTTIGGDGSLNGNGSSDKIIPGVNIGGGFNVGLNGNTGWTKNVTELPSSQQLKFPVHIVPSGYLPRETYPDHETLETVYIHVPSAVAGEVPR
ncbi:hypothetical protein AAD018_015810, partial [Aestuariibius insulae]|uniref:hypothetical protein n=1 Tax=Aestuariibius insulae TaxID=2058287 RepID=UPI00398F4959